MTPLIALALWLAAPAPDSALQSAWSAVEEMERGAVTPADRRFAAEQRKLVASVQQLVDSRNAARLNAGSDAAKLKQAETAFDLQYLQLKSRMQHENRSYTAISKIMKTKHDTVKNSISNVR